MDIGGCDVSAVVTQPTRRFMPSTPQIKASATLSSDFASVVAKDAPQVAASTSDRVWEGHRLDASERRSIFMQDPALARGPNLGLRRLYAFRAGSLSYAQAAQPQGLRMTSHSIRVLACKPAHSPDTATAIGRELCPPKNGQQFAMVSVDPTTGFNHMPATSLDASQLAGFWTLAFTTVVGLWFVSAHVGALLGFIRRG
ncbi:hypothetical protein PCO31010_01211 [Pandoraea commovens]|uniref:Uncharacterized protein n=2 Tax=Pandoraea commovens TaxID=2508289 RepID=A0A5E4T4B8_9BURK|nr:hypothetical protein PCO31010_01211 [Pandoraea commovens]